jgi:geranylgeranyl pyrophosphate synthase
MIGKSPFTDLRQKRKRLPLLIAYQVANKRGKRLIEQIMDKPILEDKDISTVASFIGNKNVIQKIGNIVSKLRLKAEKPWNQLPSSQAKIILGEVLELACDI